jgi:hypothetical protein
MMYLPVYFFDPLVGAMLVSLFCQFFAIRFVTQYYDFILTSIKEEHTMSYVNLVTLKVRGCLWVCFPGEATSQGPRGEAAAGGTENWRTY